MLIKKITSAILAVAMVAAMSTTVFASDNDESQDEHTQTKSVQRIGGTPRMTPEIGNCSVEYNSFYNWGRATSAVYGWASASYLYAEAKVSATGSTDIIQTKSTTSSQSITTDKADQPNKSGRVLTASHIVKGYHSLDTEKLLTEYYGESWSF